MQREAQATSQLGRGVQGRPAMGLQREATVVGRGGGGGGAAPRASSGSLGKQSPHRPGSWPALGTHPRGPGLPEGAGRAQGHSPPLCRNLGPWASSLCIKTKAHPTPLGRNLGHWASGVCIEAQTTHKELGKPRRIRSEKQRQMLPNNQVQLGRKGDLTGTGLQCVDRKFSPVMPQKEQLREGGC